MAISASDKTLLIVAVERAGKKLLSKQSSQVVAVTKKQDFDFGIPADVESEKFLFQEISKVSFTHRIVSEEAGKLGSTDAQYVIYLDPLDGTVNYAKDIPTFCVSLAVYTQDQEPVFSVIANPAAKELLVVDEDVLFFNGQPAERKKHFNLPLVNFEWSGALEYEKYLRLLRQHNLRSRTMGSAILNLFYTALGRGESCLLLDSKPWDIAAGLHACRASGLKFRSLSQKSIDLDVAEQSLVVYPEELVGEINFLLE